MSETTTLTTAPTLELRGRQPIANVCHATHCRLKLDAVHFLRCATIGSRRIARTGRLALGSLKKPMAANAFIRIISDCVTGIRYQRVNWIEPACYSFEVGEIDCGAMSMAGCKPGEVKLTASDLRAPANLSTADRIAFTDKCIARRPASLDGRRRSAAATGKSKGWPGAISRI
jgi:hypothetical protein